MDPNNEDAFFRVELGASPMILSVPESEEATTDPSIDLGTITVPVKTL